jgi:hypothetical protein
LLRGNRVNGNVTPEWKHFQTEQSGATEGQCDCCGTTTRRVWGSISRDGAMVASYFVTWTLGKPDHGAAFDLVLGKWGANATIQDRYAVALNYRVVEASPQFMVVDAQDRLTSGSLFGAALSRTDVIGTPLASQVFALVDALFMGDPRLDELHHWRHAAAQQ